MIIGLDGRAGQVGLAFWYAGRLTSTEFGFDSG